MEGFHVSWVGNAGNAAGHLVPQITGRCMTSSDRTAEPPSNQTAKARLRAEALAEFLDAWEKGHGPLTAAELSSAERELGPDPHQRPG